MIPNILVGIVREKGLDYLEVKVKCHEDSFRDNQGGVSNFLSTQDPLSTRLGTEKDKSIILFSGNIAEKLLFNGVNTIQIRDASNNIKYKTSDLKSDICTKKTIFNYISIEVTDDADTKLFIITNIKADRNIEGQCDKDYYDISVVAKILYDIKAKETSELLNKILEVITTLVM